MGRIIHGPYFAISYAKAKSHKNLRFGFVVSNKIERKASKRNKIKRVLREVVRNKIDRFEEGYDVVFIVKREIIGKNYEEVSSSFNKILSKISFS